MFDYSTLVGQVRRLLGDLPVRTIEESSIQNASYYIVLKEEGTATIVTDGLLINDEIMPTDSYTINKNILKFLEPLESGSTVSIEYDIVKYADDYLIEMIGDTIKNYIQGLVNIDYLFGDTTQTDYAVTFNDTSLFVHGTVLNIVGVNLLAVSGDAIYIRDGDTTINTDVSSKEASSSYKNVLTKFTGLLSTIRTNTFSGIVIGG
jgi:hypothetical protein